MSRRHRDGGFQGEFSTSLSDILTTALGCVLLLFMVAVLSIKNDLQNEQNAKEAAILRQQAEQAERQAAEKRSLEADRQRMQAEAERKKAQIEAMLQAAQKGETENALKAALEQNRSLEHELQTLRQEHQATQSRFEALQDAATIAIRDLDPRTASPVDVVLVIDATKSMQESLDTARENLKIILDTLREVSPRSRIGVVVFRDKKELPAMRLQVQPLTEDANKLEKFLAKIEATNTSRDKDLPEWLCGGLEEATKAKWSDKALKLMIIVSDAEPHKEDVPGCLKKAAEFHKSGGQIHVISTRPQGYEKNEAITKNYNTDVLRVHAEIAAKGGGMHAAKADSNVLLAAILKAAFRSRTDPIERFKKKVKQIEADKAPHSAE